jgi:phosphoenolpyruvate carboxylase
VDELLREAGVTADYLSLPEDERERVLLASSHRPGACARRSPRIRSHARGARDLRGGGAHPRDASGTGAISQYVISKTDGVSDLLEVAVLLKEVGLVTPGAKPPSRLQIVPLFETIADLRNAPAPCAHGSRCRRRAPSSRSLAMRRR